jgi:tetratricopeptide (TPR) repeat protein
VDYTEQKLEGDEESTKQIKSLLKAGDEHLIKQEFTEADAAFGKVLELMPSNFKAMIGKGTLNYHQKEYDSALDWFFKVLDIHPDYGLAHYGVSRSLLRKKDKINVKFAEIEKNFAAKDAPEPPAMRDVFINYDQLDLDLQKILRLSVQPLKNYLQTLKTAGSTFYLIPFHKLLWESPHHSGMKGTRTFDLRLWDDVKGCGGIQATSGEDWEKDVKYLRFNVVTHEFAHQVHSYLTEEQRKEIKRLFRKAKKERLTLDFYADFNEWEYFAVGVEAYVSEEKLADQKLAYGHTRKELLERDPDLYNFIEGLGKQESYEATEILAFIQHAHSFK